MLVQFALLQEALLSLRIRKLIAESLTPGQSGYLRGVEDPHLLFHEITEIFGARGRRFVAVMGDFDKAFPRCGREDVLLLLEFRVPKAKGSVFALMHDI